MTERSQDRLATGLFAEAWIIFRRNRAAMFGFILLGCIVIMNSVRPSHLPG